jgi:hypothetical protein
MILYRENYFISIFGTDKKATLMGAAHAPDSLTIPWCPATTGCYTNTETIPFAETSPIFRIKPDCAGSRGSFTNPRH